MKETVAELERQYADLEEVWTAEKATLKGAQHIKEELDSARLEFENARRAGDLARMSELQYGRIPELEKNLADAMAAEGMPAGYQFVPQPNDVAAVVLGKSTWAVLGLTLDIELFTQAHYRASVDPDPDLSPLWKDVFLFHWKEESQHAILDELEWKRESARLTPAERDAAVDDLIALVAAVDGIVQAQAKSDAEYFVLQAGRSFTAQQRSDIHAKLLEAYRWQYIFSGVQDARFLEVLGGMITPAQGERINAALGSIASSMS